MVYSSKLQLILSGKYDVKLKHYINLSPLRHVKDDELVEQRMLAALATKSTIEHTPKKGTLNNNK